MPSLILQALLLLLVAEAALPGNALPWQTVARCLQQVRPAALEQGAPLPTDSPRGADYGTCAARCEARCFLLGDFDGDGQARELAVASPQELLLFHDVTWGGKARRPRLPAPPAPTAMMRLPLSGDEVALLSLRRTVRFADEVGALRDGKSPLPALAKGERLAFGLIVWRGTQEADDQRDEGDDDLRTGETGDLMVAIFDEGARSYRLHKVLQLGAP